MTKNKSQIANAERRKEQSVMKKVLRISVVVLTLVVILSSLVARAALADEPWNKWQPIVHNVVGGTFKFTKTTWMVKSYEIPGFVGDIVAYLDMPMDEFYSVTWPACQAQGAYTATSIHKVWIGELTGRDMSYVEQERVYLCIYPAGGIDAQD
jgi:hypothetical protein